MVQELNRRSSVRFPPEYINYPHFCATFSLSIDYDLILTDKGLGNILGDILTNSSGQPAANARFGV
jgi:hypothetical protein